MKKHNRTLLVCLLIVAVFATAIGGTFAWFTDEVTSTNNVIQSGTLDIDILLKEENSWISLEKEPNTKIFNYDLWEPGYTQYEALKIVNKGNLALEYILNVISTNPVLGPNGENLAEVIDVYMAFGEKAPQNFAEIAAYKDTPDYSNGWWYCGTLDKMMADVKGFTQGYMLPSGKTAADDGVLQPGLMQGECACTVVLHMQETAGNEYQNLSLGTLGFKLDARQYTYEEDAFDDQYDLNALWHHETINVPIISNMPHASVEQLTGDELNIICTDDYQGAMGLFFLDGPQKLACGLEMKANETEEDLVGKDYADWSVDFEISSTKAISADDPDTHIYLAGHYGYENLAETGEWLAFGINGIDVTANKPERIMAAFARMKYSEIVSFVKEFKCGVIFPEGDNYFEGESLTLELCVYETDGHGNEIENGRHVIKSFTFDF